MSYTRVWIHLVFTTKNRYPYLLKDLRTIVFDHIEQNARIKKIYLEAINGHIDHVHTLIRVQPSQTIAKIAQLIKGECAHWINLNRLTSEKFEWQDDYFATSVGETQLPTVLKYISNQEVHHQNTSFEDEYRSLLKPLGSH